MRAKVVACSVVATRGGAAPPEGVLAVTGEAAAAGSAGGSRQASLGRFLSRRKELAALSVGPSVCAGFVELGGLRDR